MVNFDPMNLSLLIFSGVVATLAVVLGVVLWAQRRAWGRERASLQGECSSLRAHSADAEQRMTQAETLHRSAQQRAEDADKALAQLREEYLHQTAELAALRASSEQEIARLRKENERDRALEADARAKQEEQFRLQFKDLATQILSEQTAQFKATNKESIDLMLKPFRDNITEFRQRVEEIHSRQMSDGGALRNELKNLMELNRRITTETTNLTNALKGNSKVQGDWGELLLETILDSSSLVKGIHFDTQHSVKDAEGKVLRPDVVVNLPEHRHIIIDSKVSLTAFVAYTAAEDPAERSRYLKQHIESVRQHVTELSRKEYQRLMSSPDFVIMFVANEPAFLTALQHDPEIWSDAYAKKVIISSPTNLFALLKMVADLWKYADQDRNTKVIATSAMKLYEQAVRFSSSLEAVGAALGKAQEAYDDAHKRLCTGNDNIVRVGETLRRRASLQTKQHFSKALLDADDNVGEELVAPSLDEVSRASSGSDAVSDDTTASRSSREEGI